ncbi:leucine-rich repeat domain-containing protein [Listeria newyorkensis]|uniref:Leucine-rich repeat domain-containing protein n=1 Tax=Listeria newyorkensis TaxID=1497681 RepID=A0A841YYW2_9LIST|nr:leucine-rich repeat domain-containing protein [Listeria newyorkensis]MBC1457736.1 leucine-rich repeat domain-containing protein [Listeria newyorkensis]
MFKKKGILLGLYILLGICFWDIKGETQVHASTLESYRTLFPDITLAQEVYRTIHPEIEEEEEMDLNRSVTKEELAHVKTVTDYTRGLRIQNLTGIEHLPALETLYLEGDQTGKINSLQGIETLKQLRVLSLKNERLTSIDSLQHLPQLEEVNLVGNEIEDVTPLAGLTSLTVLNISGNKVMDLRALRDLAVVKTHGFQALSQAVTKEATTTGENQWMSIWDENGHPLSPVGFTGNLEPSGETSFYWTTPGTNKAWYGGSSASSASFSVFVTQEVRGEKLDPPVGIRAASSTPEGTPLMLLNADGQEITGNRFFLKVPNSNDSVIEANNSDAIEEALVVLNQLPSNSSQHKGTLIIPEGNWQVMRQIKVLEGITIQGESTTTALTRRPDYFEKGREDRNFQYDSLVRLYNYTTIKQLRLDGQRTLTDKPTSELYYQNGITLHGQYEPEGTVPPPLSQYQHDILIQDVQIENFNGTGIMADLVYDVTIEGTEAPTPSSHPMAVDNMGHDGIMVYSGKNVRMHQTLVRKLGHDKGDSVRAHFYGIAASMRKISKPNGLEQTISQAQLLFPVSENITVEKNVVLENPYWEGIDGHSVQNYTIRENVVIGADRAIVIGGQEYSQRYFFPSQQVRITHNRINQPQDREAWVSHTPTSQAGIVVWGTTDDTPLFDSVGNVLPKIETNKGYTEDTLIAYNTIDAIYPREVDTLFFGGIAIKLTRQLTIEQNKIGLERPHSVQVAGISLTSSNMGFVITDNQFGAIGYLETATGGKAKAVPSLRDVFSPIAFREMHNAHTDTAMPSAKDRTSRIERNVAASWNPSIIGDTKFGERSNNRFSGGETNAFQDTTTGEGVTTLTRVASAYGVTQVQWLPSFGTVEGKAGNDIARVDIYAAPIADLADLDTGKRVPIATANVDASGTFQVTGVDGAALGASSLLLVARNKHANPLYQYAVTQQLLIPSYRLTVSPYPLDSQDIVGLYDPAATKVVLYVNGVAKKSGALDASTGSYRISAKGLIDTAIQDVELVMVRGSSEILHRVKVRVEDPLTVEPYVIGEPYVRGQFPRGVTKVVLYVDGVAKKSGALQSNDPNRPYLISAQGLITNPKQVVEVVASDGNVVRERLIVPVSTTPIQTIKEYEYVQANE